MISADVKGTPNKNNQKQKICGGCIFQVLEELPSKLEIQCKKGVFFI